jgi:hypothetical protein
MRRSLGVVTLLATAAGLQAAELKSEKHPYRHEFIQRTIGKKAILPVVGGAAIRQLRNSPHEWGSGAAGFGKRVGSSFGSNLVKTSIEIPVAAIRHEDLHYYPSDKSGFMPRLDHALVSTVITRKTTTGDKTVASGKITGAFAGGLIATAWQPAGLSVAGGAASGGISLGAAAGFNVAREFWPRKHAAKAVPVETPQDRRNQGNFAARGPDTSAGAAAR